MSGRQNGAQQSEMIGGKEVADDELNFECPICLKWLQDPMLTSCGHHFCRLCIAEWLEREGACCPIDNIPLRRDSDLFPDNYTRRVISQQRTKCAYVSLGCNVELSPPEMEAHVQTCPFINRTAQTCAFQNVGCDFKTKESVEMNEHLEKSTQEHLTLLSKAFSKITFQSQNTLSGSSQMPEAQFWDPPPKGDSEPNYQLSDAAQELIKTMYEKIIVLEQHTNEQEIRLTNLTRQLSEVKAGRQDMLDELSLRHCCGVHIWKVTDFKEKLELMRNDHSRLFYSQGFYTSPNGYRFCARLNLSPKESHYLALLIHTMQTEHDECLDWPFNGRITLTIVHPTNYNYNIKETMMTKPQLEAFQKPKVNRNPTGFGYTEFVTVDELKSRDFLHNNCLYVKIQVQPV